MGIEIYFDIIILAFFFFFSLCLGGYTHIFYSRIHIVFVLISAYCSMHIVFAYGQTGTGKTYTMEGDIDSKENMGVIPRAVKSIFEGLNAKDSTSDDASVKVSFLEIYNEDLRDLLSVADLEEDKKLRVIEDKSKLGKGIACHNLEEIIVKNPEDILAIMKKALAKRHVGETQLNRASSRSHCIFTLTVHIKETTPEGEDLLKIGKLNLVDLAGSECIGRSGARNERAREAGTRMHICMHTNIHTCVHIYMHICTRYVHPTSTLR